MANQAIIQAMQAFITCFRQEWQINIGAPSSGTACLLRKARARIQGATILMKRNIERIGVMVKNILGAITMVYIRIYHSDFADAILAS